MKTEELKALGLTDEQIQKIHALNGADIEKLKSDNATLTAQLAEKDGLLATANGKLEGYDPDWKAKAAQAAADADAKVKTVKNGYALRSSIKAAGGKHPEAIVPFIDQSKLVFPEADGGEIVGLSAQIDSLKAGEYADLFNDGKEAPRFGGSTPGAKENIVGTDDKHAQANAALRSIFKN